MIKEEKELLYADPLGYLEYKFAIPKNEYFDNEIYYQVYDWLFDRTVRYIHLFGGRGSAKSYELGKISVFTLLCLPFARLLGVRKFKNTIKTSLFREVVDYIEYWRLGDYFHITRVPMYIECKLNGNFMNFEGLDKPDSIKSYKDLTHVLLEEINQEDEYRKLNKVDKTVRTVKHDNLKIILAYNTDKKKHFLYDIWHDMSEKANQTYAKIRAKSKLLKTTYLNNKFINQDYVDLLEQDKEINPDQYLCDALGEFMHLKVQGLFYNKFESEYKILQIGLKDRVYKTEMPLYISFDFNVYPYISLEIACLHHNLETNELEVCHIDEYCLTEKIDIQHTCEMFLEDYQLHTGPVYLFGDRSGYNKKVNAENDFATVISNLQETPRNQYISGANDITGTPSRINPYPLYEDLGCVFELIDRTTRSSNVLLEARRIFFQRLHTGRLSVLEPHRNNKTINAVGEVRAISQMFPNLRIIQLIDADNCTMLEKDYVELQQDPAKGGKSERVKELSHASDSTDYLYSGIFEAEMSFILYQLKNKQR